MKYLTIGELNKLTKLQLLSRILVERRASADEYNHLKKLIRDVVK